MTNRLKELTQQAHHNAERQKFANLLLSGNITPELYHYYLYNQFHIYEILESKADLSGIEDIIRHKKIRQDISELEEKYNITNMRPLTASTKDYIRYIQSLDDQSRLLAHIYVRHFGDMYGGQIIKKRIPGNGSMYDFDNKDQLITKVRSLLSDDMSDEANLCFNFATKLFKELLDE
jgi:heme oxygenase (biliverdin-producing, ferredoxin)